MHTQVIKLAVDWHTQQWEEADGWLSLICEHHVQWRSCLSPKVENNPGCQPWASTLMHTHVHALAHTYKHVCTFMQSETGHKLRCVHIYSYTFRHTLSHSHTFNCRKHIGTFIHRHTDMFGHIQWILTQIHISPYIFSHLCSRSNTYTHLGTLHILTLSIPHTPTHIHTLKFSRHLNTYMHTSNQIQYQIHNHTHLLANTLT